MNLRQAAEQIIAWYAEGQRPTEDDIVDTLREALAQPERRCEAGVSLQDLWDCWDAVHGVGQEPVAWLHKNPDFPAQALLPEEVEKKAFLRYPEHYSPLYFQPNISTKEFERGYDTGFLVGAEKGRTILIPEGWKLVPIEPTDEMIAAAEEVKQYELNTPWRRWEVMLAAAPKYDE